MQRCGERGRERGGRGLAIFLPAGSFCVTKIKSTLWSLLFTFFYQRACKQKLESFACVTTHSAWPHLRYTRSHTHRRTYKDNCIIGRRRCWQWGQKSKWNCLAFFAAANTFLSILCDGLVYLMRADNVRTESERSSGQVHVISPRSPSINAAAGSCQSSTDVPVKCYTHLRAYNVK